VCRNEHPTQSAHVRLRQPAIARTIATYKYTRAVARSAKDCGGGNGASQASLIPIWGAFTLPIIPVSHFYNVINELRRRVSMLGKQLDVSAAADMATLPAQE
jgi:hypothetical protein